MVINLAPRDGVVRYSVIAIPAITQTCRAITRPSFATTLNQRRLATMSAQLCLVVLLPGPKALSLRIKLRTTCIASLLSASMATSITPRDGFVRYSIIAIPATT